MAEAKPKTLATEARAAPGVQEALDAAQVREERATALARHLARNMGYTDAYAERFIGVATQAVIVQQFFEAEAVGSKSDGDAG